MNTKTDKLTLSIEDLNGHSAPRDFDHLINSLRDTGGIIAFRQVPLVVVSAEVTTTKATRGGGARLQAVVQCVYSADTNDFVLKVLEDDGWTTLARYKQGREEMELAATYAFIREVFEAEGRGA